MPGAPHEVVLIVDGTTGQNALAQVQAFDAAVGLTGLVVTKLDGTAKGGVLAAIAAARGDRPLPILFIGVGEGIDDLQPFSAARVRRRAGRHRRQSREPGRGRPRLEQLPARDRSRRRRAHRARGLLEGDRAAGGRPRRHQQALEEVDRDRARDAGAHERAIARHAGRAGARRRHADAAPRAQRQRLPARGADCARLSDRSDLGPRGGAPGVRRLHAHAAAVEPAPPGRRHRRSIDRDHRRPRLHRRQGRILQGRLRQHVDPFLQGRSHRPRVAEEGAGGRRCRVRGSDRATSRARNGRRPSGRAARSARCPRSCAPAAGPTARSQPRAC